MWRRALFAVLVLALGCKQETPAAPPAARGASSPAPTARAEPPPRVAPLDPSEVEGIRVLERVTGGASAGDALPLVIAIHGRGDRPDHFSDVLGGFPARARFIFPRGTDPIDDGFAWFPMSSRMPPDAFAADVSRAADRVARMIAALASSRPTAGKPIVTGFSQGGFLSFAVAILHPEVVGVAIPVSGRLPREIWPSSWPPGKVTPPIHALHGDADPLVPIGDDRQLVDQLKKMGFPADLREYPGVPHTITPAMRRDWFDLLTQATDQAKMR